MWLLSWDRWRRGRWSVASNDWLAGLVGFVLGVGISLLNGWLCDKYVDPIIARHQKTLLKPAIQILANMAAFVWAFLVSALAMLCPLAIFGQRALQ